MRRRRFAPGVVPNEGNRLAGRADETRNERRSQEEVAVAPSLPSPLALSPCSPQPHSPPRAREEMEMASPAVSPTSSLLIGRSPPSPSYLLSQLR
eukprot:scaffold234672_cov29-Tisochrysis_lutea.AAC.1